MRFIVFAIAALLVACPGPGSTEPGGVEDPDAPKLTDVTGSILPVCTFNGRIATTQAEALSQWGEPCSTDLFGGVHVWYYRTARCRLDTMPGPLDDFCLDSCSGDRPLHPVTFEGGALVDCRPSPDETEPQPPVYEVTRYEHHDSAATVFGAQCPGSDVLVGGACGCTAPGATSNSSMTGTHLNVLQCSCSSPGVSVYISCVSSDTPSTVVDGTP